jgi:hypothetical protein
VPARIPGINPSPIAAAPPRGDPMLIPVKDPAIALAFCPSGARPPAAAEVIAAPAPGRSVVGAAEARPTAISSQGPGCPPASFVSSLLNDCKERGVIRLRTYQYETLVVHSPLFVPLVYSAKDFGQHGAAG